MATSVLPLATSGGCFCCPTYVTECCAYRLCGISSRLFLETSEGNIFLINEGGNTWSGSLWIPLMYDHTTVPLTTPPLSVAANFTLQCLNGEWVLELFATFGGQANESLGASDTAVAVNCDDNFRLTFLFSDLEFGPGINNLFLNDITAVVTEAKNDCRTCCCFPNGMNVLPPLSFTDGDELYDIIECRDPTNGEEVSLFKYDTFCLFSTTSMPQSVTEVLPVGESVVSLQLLAQFGANENGKCTLRVYGIGRGDLVVKDDFNWVLAIWEAELTNCSQGSGGGTISLPLIFADDDPCRPPETLLISAL